MRDALLVPEVIALPRARWRCSPSRVDCWRRPGFEVEAFGDDTFLLRTVPALLRGHDVRGGGAGAGARPRRDGATLAATRAADAVLATLACHSAVRVGQQHGAGADARAPRGHGHGRRQRHCPHGRPVAVELSRGARRTLFAR